MRVVNLNNKTLREFTKDDTIYISRSENGYQIIYFCNFLGVERGMVKGSVLEIHGYGKHRVGEIVQGRASSCLLWGWDEKMKQNRCHWFKSLDTMSE